MAYPYKIIPLDYGNTELHRGETISMWYSILDKDGTPTDPTTVTIEVSDPCGDMVATDSMTSDAVGKYVAYYTIPSDGIYGKYKIKITANDGTYDHIHYDYMYMFPWDLQFDARVKAGIEDTKTISPNHLANICWQSYMETLHDIYPQAFEETPSGNPDTGATYDGSNTTFRTKHYPIADSNGDGSVTGWGETCATDVTGYWLDNAGAWKRLYIRVDNEDYGDITLSTTSDYTGAIPQDNEGVYITYRYSHRTYDEFLLQEAVAYMCAHNIMQRLKGVDQITLADLNMNRIIVEKNASRFKNKYMEILRNIAPIRAGSGR